MGECRKVGVKDEVLQSRVEKATRQIEDDQTRCIVEAGTSPDEEQCEKVDQGWSTPIG